MEPAGIAAPIQPDFATLPQPYDNDTPATAEALRERIFNPIVKSHFTLGDVKLNARRPALKPSGDTAVLDFRFHRRRTMWERGGRWMRENPGPKGAPLPSTTRDRPWA